MLGVQKNPVTVMVMGFACSGGEGSSPDVSNSITFSGNLLCIKLNRDDPNSVDAKWVDVHKFLAALE